MTKRIILLFSFLSVIAYFHVDAQQKKPVVIAYYSGDPSKISSYEVEKLTHLIFSFGHLKGDAFDLSRASDTLLLKNMVALKSRNPQLKVLVSLGGWGGCETCSEVFASDKGRKTFANSVKKCLKDFKADGIDLDWEYPAIEGFPGHKYTEADRDNFTALVKELRKALGSKSVISFAAGGFENFLRQSIDWKSVMPVIDYVNLMTYDLVSGFSKVAGPHTPLYSSPGFPESTDRAVTYLDSIGVPKDKMVIGAAFYARIFETTDTLNTGINRPASFKRGVSYKDFDTELSEKAGFKYYWDNAAQAPYCFNAGEKLFATFDDAKSIQLKTQYVLDKHLGGIMFWQLSEDKTKNGLLNVIDKTIKK